MYNKKNYPIKREVAYIATSESNIRHVTEQASCGLQVGDDARGMKESADDIILWGYYKHNVLVPHFHFRYLTVMQNEYASRKISTHVNI